MEAWTSSPRRWAAWFTPSEGATDIPLAAPDKLVVGLQQTCNFLSTATAGVVRGVATPVHRGATTHVWDVDVRSEETGKRVAAGRVTLAVRERRA